MDTWAALEHDIKYKNQRKAGGNPRSGRVIMNKKPITRLSLVLLAIMLLFAIGLSVTAMPTETAARAESKYGPVTVYNTAFEWNIYDFCNGVFSGISVCLYV